MTKELERLAEQAGLPVSDNLEHFYRLVGERCANMCGSQGDQKNIRRHFGLDYYDGPTHHQDKRWQQSQYDWSKHYVKDERGN